MKMHLPSRSALIALAVFTRRDRLQRQSESRCARACARGGRAARLHSGKQTAVFSGGCFWGVQAVFQHVKGVISATSGYSGGSAKTAEYETVSTGETGHAESVQIVYDPSQITYGELLRVFFSVAHDPTQLNRQGPDEGTQYRSSIFYSNDEQKHIAEAYIAQLDQAKVFPRPIVTKVVPLQGVLSGRGVSPELCGAASQSALHRVQRRAQGRASAAGVSGPLHRQVSAEVRMRMQIRDKPLATCEEASDVRLANSRRRDKSAAPCIPREHRCATLAGLALWQWRKPRRPASGASPAANREKSRSFYSPTPANG